MYSTYAFLCGIKLLALSSAFAGSGIELVGVCDGGGLSYAKMVDGIDCTACYSRCWPSVFS